MRRFWASSLLPRLWDASSKRDWNCAEDFGSPKWFTATLAPLARYPRAIARPMPVTPPVMAMDLPTRSWGAEVEAVLALLHIVSTGVCSEG